MKLLGYYLAFVHFCFLYLEVFFLSKGFMHLFKTPGKTNSSSDPDHRA